MIESRPCFNHFGRLGPLAGWAMSAHAHSSFHELIYVLRGEIHTRIRGQALSGKKGDALLYPSGEVHAEQSRGDEPLETCFIGWSGPLPAAPSGAPIALLVHDRAGRIRMLLDWLADCASSQPGQPGEETAALMSALLFEYTRRAEPQENLRLEKVREFIRRNLAEDLTLEQLAGQAGLSKFHFSREVKRLTGQTPMQMLRSERVSAVRALLLTTPLKLNAIARQVGFADEFQLSRVYKRVTGLSPKQMRR